jgi:hypothetical protein
MLKIHFFYRWPGLLAELESEANPVEDVILEVPFILDDGYLAGEAENAVVNAATMLGMIDERVTFSGEDKALSDWWEAH